MKKALVVIASGTVFAWAVSPAAAEVIPIQEEFVFAQQAHVDSSLDMMVISLLQEGLIDSGATLHYEGHYDIDETTPGQFTGSTAGVLTGSYLGETWAVSFDSAMKTDALQNKVWNLDSKGTWRKGPFAGKNFKDKGKLIEKPDNKADLELEIETDGESKTIKTTASNLDKEKGGGRLKVSGDIEIDNDGETHKETLTIDLDQAKQTFKSKLKSSIFGVVVLDNAGSFTVAQNGTHTSGGTSFDLTVTHMVPEPASWGLVLSGAGAVLGWRWQRRALSRRRGWPVSAGR